MRAFTPVCDGLWRYPSWAARKETADDGYRFAQPILHVYRKEV
jgi:hypothetical protein